MVQPSKKLPASPAIPLPADAPKRKELTWYDSIVQVLTDNKEPMHYTEIADAIIKQQLRTKIGATPNQTVSAVINTSLNNETDKSPFVRVSMGVYGLSGNVESSPQEKTNIEKAAISEPPSETEEVPLVGAFGMYWLRNAVKWSGANVQLMGLQLEASNPVNFAGQVGVYLLHDRDRVVYVGKVDSNERLGQRLKEHTKGRLAYRWERFSWFGLRRPTEDGKLVESSREIGEKELVGLMEAILIEAIEPGLNRQRGEGLRSVEFYQAEDPTIEKDKNQKALLRLLQKAGADDLL
jgi:hypothetical protein